MRVRSKHKGTKLRVLSLRKLGVLIVVIGGFSGGISALWASSLSLPDFETFEQRKVAESTKIYDRTGEILLFDVHENIKRTVVPLKDISIHVRNATIAIEDSEFYNHGGIRISAIIRAFFTNLLSGEVEQGGSTITQQVIKNTLLSTEQKYARKVKEAVLAVKLEKTLGKDEILEVYLNEAPYGGSIYGVEEASMAFFGKSAKDATLAEAAYLAALPKAPTYYSPHGEHREELERRKNVVLNRMRELGFVTQEESDAAKRAGVLFNSPEEQRIKAPHFVLFIKNYLEEKYGEGVITSQGLRVTTTLDWQMQQEAEDIVEKFAVENAQKFNAHNAGLVAINPKTGHVLSMVGSRNWFSEPSPDGCTPGIDCLFDPKVNIATRRPGRQPGSAFKPFVYATALEKGYTDETVVFDIQTQFHVGCTPEGDPLPGINPDTCYQPNNYDNAFRGPVTFREALAQSINVPAVKVLYLAGLEDSLRTAKKFGITTLSDIKQYGLTLVLGGGEVTLLELTSAYSVFANNGERNPPVGIIKVEDKNGNTLEEDTPRSQQVIDRGVALAINNMLSDNEARTPAFGANSPLYFPNKDVAAKTGTTNDYRDAWIVGYTPNIAVGAWAGNSNNSSMEKRVAGFVVAPMWNSFMNSVLREGPHENFPSPPEESTSTLKPVLKGGWRGGRVFYVDSISGGLATEFTPEETKQERILQEVHSTLHWVDKKSPRGPIPQHPENDPQYRLWEAGVRAWAEARGYVDEDESVLPDEFDDVHTPENRPVITDMKPAAGQSFRTGEQITVSVSTQSVYPVEQVDFYFNNTYIGSSKKTPYTVSFTPEISVGGEQQASIRIRVYDAVKNRVELTTPVTLLGINTER